jgi:hypothetical protein
MKEINKVELVEVRAEAMETKPRIGWLMIDGNAKGTTVMTKPKQDNRVRGRS